MKEFVENGIICKCKKVSLADIENALHEKTRFPDVEKEFEHVQQVMHCSTGCGGCYEKILDVLSKHMSG